MVISISASMNSGQLQLLSPTSIRALMNSGQLQLLLKNNPISLSNYLYRNIFFNKSVTFPGNCFFCCKYRGVHG